MLGGLFEPLSFRSDLANLALFLIVHWAPAGKLHMPAG